MKDYDSKKPSTFITYLDMNNLYGWAMSEYLPYGGFNWLKNVDGFDVNSVSEKSTIGLFSQSWPWISWWITWIAQWLSNSSKKNLLFLVICCQSKI